MIDTSPTNLLAEIQSSERFMKSRLESLDSQISRMTGPFFKGPGSDVYDPENHEFEVIALLAPKIVFDNPRVRISTKLPGSQAHVAEALQAAVNRQIMDQDLRRPLLLATIDSLLRWGVLLTTLEPDSERGAMDMLDGATPQKPVTKHLSNRVFGWDPQATKRSEARYFWHKWVSDKDTLIARALANPDEGWNAEAIEALGSGAGTETLGRAKNDDKVARNEIVGYELWIPEARLDDEPGAEDGFHGVIYTLAFNQTSLGGDFIRAPRPYYGPPWGPYTVVGIYDVPDETAPLAPTVAIKGAVDMLNAKVRALHTMDLAYKKIGVVSAKDPLLQAAVNNAKSGDVVVANADEIAKNWVEAEIGGATDTLRLSVLDERARVAQYAGMSDANRGTVTGEGTATENAIADQSSDTRIGFIQQQVNEAAKQVCKTYAWFDYYLEDILFPLGQEDVAEMMQSGVIPPMGAPQGEPLVSRPEVWYRGGEHQEGSGYCFADLELDIEPYSMERTSEALQQQRFMGLMEFLTVQLPALIAQPYISIKEVVQLAGNVMNLPRLGKIVDAEIAAQVQLIAVQGMLMPAQGEEQGKTSSSVGAGKREAPTGPTARPQLPQRPTMPQKPFQGAQAGQAASKPRTVKA